MADDQADHAKGPAITSEERLRALTSDRKPKSKGKAASTTDTAGTRPGDLVDAVRERTTRDSGRDRP